MDNNSSGTGMGMIRCPLCGMLALVAKGICDNCGTPLNDEKEMEITVQAFRKALRMPPNREETDPPREKETTMIYDFNPRRYDDYFRDEVDRAMTQKPNVKTDNTIPGRQHKQGGQKQQYTAPQGSSILGYDVVTNEPVMVTHAARRQGLYIIGIQGTGKSVLIENLIIQDIKQGLGVCLLDPHGDLTDAVFSRLPAMRVVDGVRRAIEEDVIVLDIASEDYPFGLNLFTCDNPKSAKAVQVVVDQVMHIFEKLFDLSASTTPRIRQYLRNCTYTLVFNPGSTMVEIPLLLLDEQCRKRLVANVRNLQAQGFWKTYNAMKPSEQLDHADSTLNKLDEILQPLTVNIVGQSTSTIDLRTIMDERKILLVKLSAQMPSITSLIGSIIIAFFLNAAYSRADLPLNRRKQFNLYADEFQRFATEDFAELLEQARKYGIATTIAHQNRGQLDSKNSQLETNLKDRTRSVANLIVFKINSKDADELAGEFDCTPEPQWEEPVEEIDGTEPVKAIAQNPVELLRSSHENPVVRAYASQVISPLFTVLASVNQEGYYGLVSMCATRSQLQQGIQLLNQLFVAVMEGQIVCTASALAWQLADIILALRGYFGLASGMQVKYRKARTGQETWDVRDIRTVESQPNSELKPLLAAFITSIATVIIRSPSFLESPISYVRHTISGTGYEGGKLKDYLMEQWNQLDHWWGYSREEWIKYAEPKTREKELAEALEKLTDQIQAIVCLCLLLAREPILVNTGQEKPRIRLRYITHHQRSYDDMRNEVASELVNLPMSRFEKFARVKITTDNGIEEHTIKTLDPKQQPERPLFGQALQERIARIQEHNKQEGYVRPREEVEAEIRQRQEQCSQPPEDEPPISRRPLR